MTAREMFKELGYELYEGYSRHPEIEYRRRRGWEYDSIVFDTEKKVVETPDYYIDLSLYKAILKQIEELGWLDQ